MVPSLYHSQRKEVTGNVFFLAAGDPEYSLPSHASAQTEGGEFSVHARGHLPDCQFSHGRGCCQPATEASAL